MFDGVFEMNEKHLRALEAIASSYQSLARNADLAAKSGDAHDRTHFEFVRDSSEEMARMYETRIDQHREEMACKVTSAKAKSHASHSLPSFQSGEQTKM